MPVEYIISKIVLSILFIFCGGVFFISAVRNITILTNTLEKVGDVFKQYVINIITLILSAAVLIGAMIFIFQA